MKKRDGAKYQELIEVVARGSQTIREWAAANGVRYSTARAWACLPEFRQKVAEIRQAAFDSALGRMTALLNEAVDKLGVLIKDGERKDLVQLQAVRGLISDLVAMRETVSRDQEIADLHAEVEALKRSVASNEAPSLKVAGS